MKNFRKASLQREAKLQRWASGHPAAVRPLLFILAPVIMTACVYGFTMISAYPLALVLGLL